MRTYALLSTAFGLAFLSVSPCLNAQRGAEVDEARRLLREASALIPKLPEDQRSTAVSNIAGKQALAGDLQSAFETAQQFSKPQEHSTILRSIVWSLDHNGDTNAALKLLSTIEDAGNTDVYYFLAIAHARRNDFEEAARLAARSRNPELEVVALVTISENQFKAGDRRGAEATLQSARDAAQRDYAERRYATEFFVRVAAAQSKIGNHGEAMATLDCYRQIAADTGSEETRRNAIKELAIGLARIGEVALAEETARELPHHEFEEALVEIAAGKAQSGDIQSAIQSAVSIREDNFKWVAIHAIALHQSESDDFIGSAETLKNLSTNLRVSEMATVALNMADRGQHGAADALQLAEDTAAKAGNDAPPRAFEFFAVTHGLLHQLGTAKEMIMAMENPESRVWPLWNITEMMVEAGDVRGAIALAENETDPHPKCYALLGTATGLLNLAEEERKKASH